MSPEKKDWIAATATKPQMMRVGKPIMFQDRYLKNRPERILVILQYYIGQMRNLTLLNLRLSVMRFLTVLLAVCVSLNGPKSRICFPISA